jgi:hypothetical protein
MRASQPPGNPPPTHLSARAAEFWREVDSRFVLEPHDLERLRVLAECLDGIDRCREVLDKEGFTFLDKHGQPRTRPETIIVRDLRTLALRSLRELSIDIELPAESRLPRQARR